MAINYHKGPSTLVSDLEKRGFKIKTVVSVGEKPVRAVQVQLYDGVTVNWDREGQCIWAEGPWAASQKVERYLRRIYENGWKRNSGLILGPLILAIILALLWALLVHKSKELPLKAVSTAELPAAEPE